MRSQSGHLNCCFHARYWVWRMLFSVLWLHVSAAEHDAGLHPDVHLPASYARQHGRFPRQGLRCCVIVSPFVSYLLTFNSGWLLKTVNMTFFKQLKRPDSCLARMMSLKRDKSLTSYLWNAHLYKQSKSETVRFAQSFLPYCITHFTYCNVLVTFNISFLGLLAYIMLFPIQPLAALRNKDISFIC